MATSGVHSYYKILQFILIFVIVTTKVYGGTRGPTYVKLDHNGDTKIIPGKDATLQIKGQGLSRGLELALTKSAKVWGTPCSDILTSGLTPELKGLSHSKGRVFIPGLLTESLYGLSEVYLCTREVRKVYHKTGREKVSSLYTNSEWIHQGPKSKVDIEPIYWNIQDNLSPRVMQRRSAQNFDNASESTVSVGAPVTTRSNSNNDNGDNSDNTDTVTHSVNSSSGNSADNGTDDRTRGFNSADNTSHKFGVQSDTNEGVGNRNPVTTSNQPPTTQRFNNGLGFQGNNGQGFNGNGQGFQPNGQGFQPNGQGFQPNGQGFQSNGQGFHSNNQGFHPNVQALLPNNQGFPANQVFPASNGQNQANLGHMKKFTSNMQREPSDVEEIGSVLTLLDDNYRRVPNGVPPIRDNQVFGTSQPLTDVSVYSEPHAGATPTIIVPSGTQVFGMRVEKHDKGLEYDEGGIASLLADTDAELRLFGIGFTEETRVQFTGREGVHGDPCDKDTTSDYQVSQIGLSYAVVKVQLRPMMADQKHWYICIRDTAEANPIHQGSVPWLAINTYTIPVPLWVQIIFLFILLCLSGLFSGLNLGLMALDKTELKIVSNTGTPQERKYARAIEPVRSHGNFLLCTLLLGNVLVNSTLTIVLDTLTSGLVAVIGSTIGIVIFGEIIPQAICSRHGLAIGARTVWLVRIFMVITGIASWPISKVLDLILGEEIGNTYDRERLKELIKVTHAHNDLQKEEQNIICGALEMHKKTVCEVMTKLEDVFMLNVDVNLDFNTINEIMQQGYSRIPIYENEKTNIISVLFIKDLAFIDPDDNTPLRTLCQFYQNPCNFVFEDTTLDIMFKEFKDGNKGHMAFIQRINNEGECDPYYEIIGLVTLEDVIEELIQEEIVDETDIFMDNRTKKRRHLAGKRDFKEFSQANEATSHRKIQISPQLQVAALQFLRTSIEPFKEGYLSENIVTKILKQDVIHMIKVKSKDSSKSLQHTYIYHQGKPVDFFVLILEGHVEVTIGRENLTFESGPFTCFGQAALTHQIGIGESPSASTQLSRGSITMGSVQSIGDAVKFSFIPDYSVRAITEVTFLKIRRSHYLAAKRAYLIEQKQKGTHVGEAFDREMAKILREDDPLNSPVWEPTPLTTPGSKDGLSNGAALKTQPPSGELELTIQNLVNSRNTGRPSVTSCPHSIESFRNAASVPGTPLADRGSFSQKGGVTSPNEIPPRKQSVDRMTEIENLKNRMTSPPIASMPPTRRISADENSSPGGDTPPLAPPPAPPASLPPNLTTAVGTSVTPVTTPPKANIKDNRKNSVT